MAVHELVPIEPRKLNEIAGIFEAINKKNYDYKNFDMTNAKIYHNDEDDSLFIWSEDFPFGAVLMLAELKKTANPEENILVIVPFFSCPNCGDEGFFDDMLENHNNEDEECVRYSKEVSEYYQSKDWHFWHKQD